MPAAQTILDAEQVAEERARCVLPERRWVCRALQGINRFFVRAHHDLEVLAPAHLPEHGAAILVCNHTSGLDPHLIQSCCRRLITWMMAREYYDVPVARQIFDELGVIPVARSGRDMAAMRAAMRALEQGQILGVFPEGRIETGDTLLPFQTGVALMAIKTGAPVYCAYLDGTQRRSEMLPAFLRRQRARILFGAEVRFDRSGTTRPRLEAATAAMQAAVEALRERAHSLPRR